MLVYVDTNIYCRPFDHESNQRVILETEACVAIFEAIRRKEHVLVGSDMLLIELSQLDQVKTLRVKQYLELCGRYVKQSEEIRTLAKQIEDAYSFKPRDAVHVASAIMGKADALVTCDDGLIKKREKVSESHHLIIIDPITFNVTHL